MQSEEHNIIFTAMWKLLKLVLTFTVRSAHVL